jgi:uncharacterized membrane protein
MIHVTLYSRDDCHLCDETLNDLESMQKVVPHEISIVNIDSDPKLIEQYGSKIPVVEVGPFRLNAPISRQELLATLEATQIREKEEQPGTDTNPAVGVKRAVAWSKADDLAYWISKHYLAVFNAMILLYVGLPFLAPILMQSGAQLPANIIYRGYGLLCHQLAYRSIFLFGEQPVYPRAAADVDGYLTYTQSTGLAEGDSVAERFEARAYLGDDRIGYKVALCQRDVAIYSGILLFGIIFGLTGKRIPGLPWYLWILLGILPIALDGLSQLISQPPLTFISYRESTPLLRLITGFLFGFTTAWFGYPLVEQAMKDTRELMKSKHEGIKTA